MQDTLQAPRSGFLSGGLYTKIDLKSSEMKWLEMNRKLTNVIRRYKKRTILLPASDGLTDVTATHENVFGAET